MAQPRTDSGRFGSKAAPDAALAEAPPIDEPAELPAPPPAVQPVPDKPVRGRFVVEPPMPLSQFSQIINFHGRDGDQNTRQWRANTERLQKLKAWFKAIAAHPESTSGDLWIAWLAWTPHMMGVKWANRSWFDEMDVAAQLKTIELHKRREQEQAVIRGRQAMLASAARHRAALAEHDKQCVIDRERLVADLDAAEAALREAGIVEPEAEAA